MSIKILNENYNATEEDIVHYRTQSIIKHRRPADLRFGKIIGMTDFDLDG